MDELLTMLKTDLSITTTAYDARLRGVLSAARDYIRAAGAQTLDTAKFGDAQLVVMYAAWLWRRRDEMSGMPRMLQWSLHNRVLGEKMGGGSNGQCS